MATLNVSELYLACRNGDLPTVQRLLPQTPLKILNRLEPNGSTCLHAASFHGHKEIVRVLLAHGACRRVQNRYGCTALDEAKTQEIADLFPRSTVAAKQRYAANPAQQTEWQFTTNDAEAYSRALHWGCIKDRGLKKTVKKIRKAHILDNDDDPETQIVQELFNQALAENDPVLLLRAYTAETSFYRQLNTFMATGKRSEVYKKLCKKWSGYYTGMIVKNRAFDRFRYSGQTYRGMEITPQDYSLYEYGKVLTNKSFQSTSKSWKIAKGFACPSEPKPGRLPVIIILNITDKKSALNIEEISEFDYEEEVLIVPGTFFIVAQINQEEVPYEIHLNQIEWKDEF